ncbi:hypothetical protein GE09DRAFT_979446 [Coniochaeta sp. 2T2.1]|nr:hypothetical protein GE09DRAFT_979446 [Coniochaeta sp. 2T2.1]
MGRIQPAAIVVVHLGLGFRMLIDTTESNYIGVIVDFDGNDGAVYIEGEYYNTGRGKDMSGRRLCITTDVVIFGVHQPSIEYVHRRSA